MYVSCNKVPNCFYSKCFKILTSRTVAIAVRSFPLKKWRWFDESVTVGLNNVSLFPIHPRATNRWRLSCTVRHFFSICFLEGNGMSFINWKAASFFPFSYQTWNFTEYKNRKFKPRIVIYLTIDSIQFSPTTPVIFISR
jgi:hypothetical protein